MTFAITFLPGDGIGPEVAGAARRVLEAVCADEGIELSIVEKDFGGAAIDATGEPLPADTLKACLEADGVFLGAVGGPKWDGGGPRPEAGLLGLRAEMGVYANLRPMKLNPALAEFSPLRPERTEGTDILIVRELTGGLYFGERSEGKESASDAMTYTEEEVARIARIAFDAAERRKGRVTSVDKANVLATSRLWRHVVTEVSKEYPSVALDHVLVDAMAMHLIQRPSGFDVVVTENLFGDILSDEASVIGASIGLLGSASLGDGHRGLYEPIHGSAPDIAGKGIGNPIGAIASAAMMLRFSAKAEKAAARIEAAIEQAIASGIRTADIGGDAKTDAVADAVIAAL